MDTNKMIELARILFSVSLSGSVLMILMLFVKSIFKKHLSARWQYYIWLIVIVRLLIPALPWDGVIGRFFSDLGQPSYLEEIYLPVSKSQRTDSSVRPVETRVDGEPAGSDPDPADSQIGQLSDYVSLSDYLSSAAERVMPWIWILWAMIAVTFFIRKVTIYQSFQKYINSGRREPDDPEILNLFDDVCERLAIRRIPRLYTNSLIASPILSGLIHPCIFLPGIPKDNVELELILTHELIHYKHKDPWFIWLVQMVLSIHWFNPLIHYMAVRIRQDREFACDESVIGTLRQEQHYTYGEVLIRALENSGTYRESVISVALHENALLLKQRLEAIYNNAGCPKRFHIPTMILTILIFTAGLMLGSYRPEMPLAAVPSVSKPQGTQPVTEELTVHENIEYQLEDIQSQFSYAMEEVDQIRISQISGDLKVVTGETDQLIVEWTNGKVNRPILNDNTLSVTGSDTYDEQVIIYLPADSMITPDTSWLSRFILIMDGGTATINGLLTGSLQIESIYADIMLNDCTVRDDFTFTGEFTDLQAEDLTVSTCDVKKEMGQFAWKSGSITESGYFQQDFGEMALDQLQAYRIDIKNEMGELNLTNAVIHIAALENNSIMEAKHLTVTELKLTQHMSMMDLADIRAESLDAFVENGLIQFDGDIQDIIKLRTRNLGKLELSLDGPRSLWNISADTIYDNALSAFFLNNQMEQYPYWENEQANKQLTVIDENSVGQFIKIRFKSD